MQKMLIAIDSEIFIEALERAFNRKYEIHTCSSGNEALQFLQNHRPDVLIIGLSFPDITGLTVLQQTGYVPPIVIALTNYLSDRIVCESQAAGVNALIRIPCTVKCIESHINTIRRKLPSQD